MIRDPKDKNIEDRFSAFEEKLDSILEKGKQSRSTGFIEVLTAILLSLATVGSAWCAFQSALWGGVQTFELAAAGKAGRLATENTLKGLQLRFIDAVLVMQYVNAQKNGDQKLADFYFSRFDENLQKATLEWLEKDPFNNPKAPNSPLKMPSYNIKEETAAFNEEQLNLDKMESANNANKNSDRYILLTVLFAGVLFFGGIASTLKSNLIKNVCLLLSALIFVSTVIVLLSMPVTTI